VSLLVFVLSACYTHYEIKRYRCKMNVDYGIPPLVIIAITIVVFIIAINKYLNAPHLSPEEKVTQQIEVVDLFIKRNPQVRGSFVAAERDGATHIKCSTVLELLFIV